MRRLAAELQERYPRIDVLVNNVGGFWAHRHVTEDGLELTFALNHLAPFLLTNLLIDRMRAQEHARIVTVTSSAEALGTIDFDDLQETSQRYSGQRAYNQSKLANLLFTLRTGAPAPWNHGHRERRAPGRHPHRLRRRGPGAVLRLDGRPRTPVHALARTRRRHGRLGGLVARARGRHRAATSTIAARSARPRARSTRRPRSGSGRSARSWVRPAGDGAT